MPNPQPNLLPRRGIAFAVPTNGVSRFCRRAELCPTTSSLSCACRQCTICLRGSAFVLLQSVAPSTCSSTSPTSAMLSPLMMYNPSVTCTRNFSAVQVIYTRGLSKSITGTAVVNAASSPHEEGARSQSKEAQDQPLRRPLPWKRRAPYTLLE